MEHASGIFRRNHRVVANAAAFLLLGGCGMMGYQAPPVSPALTKHSRASSAVLERGFAVHQAKCAKCHPYENPANHTPDELRNDVMPVMARKSKLDAADEQAVLAYLLAAREMPPPENQNP